MKRLASLLVVASLSGIAWADLVINLAVTGVLVAGLVLGAGLITAGAGAAWGLGVGLGFDVAGLSFICANGLASFCSSTPDNPAATVTTPLSAVLVPGGSTPPDSYAARTISDVCKQQYADLGTPTFPGYCDYSQTPDIIPGAVYCYDWSIHLDGVCSAPGEQFGAANPSGGGRDLAGKFIPQGDNLLGSVPGTWTQTVPGSKWDFTPSNPSDPVAEISSDNQSLKLSTLGNNGSPVDVVCQNYSDGSMNCSRGADVPVLSSQGTASTVKVVLTQSYNAGGTSSGSPVLQYSPIDSNNQPFDPALYSLSPSVGGNGGTIIEQGTSIPGSGIPTPDPGTTGGCTGGDCAKESTLLGVKGILQSLMDFFTGTATTPSDPTSKTGTEINAASLDGSGAFVGLRGWQLPAHSSQCPTSSFDWNGNTYTFDAHCQLATDHFAMFRGVMTLVFSISALFVVLKA